MTFDDILNNIGKQQFAPVYFLHGEEPYFIDRIEQAVEAQALPEAERAFNQTIVYGKDADAKSLLDVLRRYPMMSARQLVLLREAQDMKSLADLESYVSQPMPTTVLVVSYKHKKYDMRSKLGKALKDYALVFEGKKLYDNQVADWVGAYCKARRLSIDAPAAQLIGEYLGADLAKISNELDKLALNLPAGTSVNAQHVQDYIGISKEYNVYELQKALAMRDTEKVFRIARFFGANPRKNPLVVTIGSLFAYFSKVYMLHFLKNVSDAEVLKTLDLRSDWFLKEYKQAANRYSLSQTAAIIGLLHAFDLRSKGVDTDLTNTSEDALMTDLFYKILHT
jgi:DNA polymerase-3 subunit delta